MSEETPEPQEVETPEPAETGEASEPVEESESSEDEALEPGRVPISVSLGRFATGAFQAVTTATAVPAGERGARFAALRKFALPITTLACLLVILSLFHEILLPFIMALVIVYLMEPIVGRLARGEEDSKGLPRWLAVISVYIAFLGVITTTLVLMTPQFVSEIVRFAETVPEDVQTFREEKLPAWNDKVQSTIATYLPQMATPKEERPKAPQALDFEPASAMLHKARREAMGRAVAQYEASRRLRWATDIEVTSTMIGGPAVLERVWKAEVSERSMMRLERPMGVGETGSWQFVWGGERPTFKVVPSQGGGFELYVERVDLEIEQTGPAAWRVRETKERKENLALPGGAKTEAFDDLREMFDLEHGLNELLENLIKSSNQQISGLLTFAQRLVVGIIETFVALVLTLMVAAFISIDLHSVMNFFRSLIPAEHRERYDELLSETDRGLSGVVRGQLLICVVNGVLTYIGLAILGIKFSLLLAVVAGVLSLIPIFGTILSTVPIVLFGLTNGLMTGVFALGWILGIHFLEANLLNPKIIGTSAHIHPVIVIFALLAGESAFGLIGALLAVPTASILLTIFKFFLMRTGRWEEAVEAAEETARREGTRPVSPLGVRQEEDGS